MNKLREFFSNINRDLLVGILCLLAGAAFIFAPGNVLHVLIRIAGAVTALLAVLRFIYATRRLLGRFMTVTIVNSALLFLVGLVMLVSPDGMLHIIFIAIGAYLMINAIGQIFKFAIAPKRLASASWWIEIISSALILILGFWLIFSPDEATRVTEVIAGISLILKAIELFGKANINRKVPPTRKSGDMEADFVDKSDEL